jgi:uncharacterized membrane protein YeaQ/YmgE (transglycosylase-associated protein family)
VKARLSFVIWYKEKFMHVLLWVIDGLVAGWVTGKVMAGEGRDLVMDMVMGVAGAVAGAFLFSAAHLLVRGAMIYTNVAAILGAVILASLSRSLSGRREYGSTD